MSWAQVAEALGTGEAAARAAYRAWAEGQHDMLTWTESRLSISHAEHAEAIQRVADDAGPDGASERAAAGPGAILCAHADRNGEGAHWLKTGETCTEALGREPGQ